MMNSYTHELSEWTVQLISFLSFQLPGPSCSKVN